MKTVLSLLALLITLFSTPLFSQVGLSVSVLPRVEKVPVREIQQNLITRTKVNTYTTFATTIRKNKWYYELGVGVLQRFDQGYSRSGTVYYGGGSGEIGSTSFLYTYNFNYTDIQFDLNVGRILGEGPLQLFLGGGLQLDYLIHYNGDFRRFQSQRPSAYLKVNPRYQFSENKIYLELNNAFGAASRHSPFAYQFTNVKRGPHFFYETGITLGYQF